MLVKCSGSALLFGAAFGLHQLWLVPTTISQTFVLGSGKDLGLRVSPSSWIATAVLDGGQQLFVVAQGLKTHLFHLLGALRELRLCSD